MTKFFFVQRASISFWRSLCGLFFHSSGAVPVCFMCLFSSLVFRWRGASTKLASTILPSLAKTPAASSISLNVLNMSSITFFSISCSLNTQNVLLSGTLSLFFISRKRLKLALSTIWNSSWSSDRLYKPWTTSALNIISLSNGGRPPLDWTCISTSNALDNVALKIFQSM